MARAETTVAIDGSLFKHHPRLKASMERYISVMAPGRKVVFKRIEKLLKEFEK